MIADAPVQAIINKTPHPKQRYALWLLGLDASNDFHDADGVLHRPMPKGGPVNELLFGGMARGGKSQLIRFVITLVAQQWPGSKVAVFRQFTEDLTMTHVMPLLKELPIDAGRFNWKHMVYTWNNGSTTEFNHCAEQDDHLRFRSFEWDVVIFDEATELPEHQLTFLRSRCSSTNPGWYPRILYATNPTGPGHLYLKRNFVTARDPGVPFWGPWEAKEAGLGTEGQKDFRYRRCYLRSSLYDNLSLSPAEALAALASISDPILRTAMAEGNWDIQAGNFFSDFRESTHVCEPFEIPKDWYVWRAVDWGSAAPAACIWGARNPADPYRRIWIYRYWQQAGLTDRQQAATILNLSHNDPPTRLTLADPSMFNKTRGALGQTSAQEYAAAGLVLTKANNRRKQGWARIRQSLATVQSYGPNMYGEQPHPPELQIFRHTDLTGTGELIREIANIEYSKTDLEDIKEPTNLTDLRDEGLDTLRELCQGAAAVSRPPSRPRHWGYRTETPEPRRRR